MILETLFNISWRITSRGQSATKTNSMFLHSSLKYPQCYDMILTYEYYMAMCIKAPLDNTLYLSYIRFELCCRACHRRRSI